MAKSLVQRYEAFCRIIRICSAICGADIVDPNYRPNWLTWFVITAINFYFALTFYTIYVSLIVEGDWPSVLQALCMIGSGIQGYCKLLNAIWNRKNLKFLLDELHDIYEVYEQKHADYRCHLNKSMNLVTKLIQSVALTYVATTSCFLLLTVVLRLFYNMRVFVLQLFVPGLDPNTEIGYWTLNFAHLILVLFGAFGNFAGDMYFFTYISHLPLLKNILSCKFHDLNDVLSGDIINTVESMELLKDIFRWHQKYIIIIGIVRDTYFWIILIQIFTISMGIACTLFCIILGRWPGGYLYLLYSFLILYFYCGLGTLVELSNDGFVYSCYDDVIWYKLTAAEQKMLQIMLMMTQNTVGLTVGAVAPLTMNTGLQVTKAVYTWAMMLLNFVN